MDSEIGKGEQPKQIFFNISKGLERPETNSKPRTERVAVEISPDGNNYTTKFQINGRDFTGTANKNNGETPEDAVSNAINSVPLDDSEHDWFISHEPI